MKSEEEREKHGDQEKRFKRKDQGFIANESKQESILMKAKLIISRNSNRASKQRSRAMIERQRQQECGAILG